MAGFLLITDDTTPDELAEAITHCGVYAKRQPHVMGDAAHPSGWDLAHQKLDLLLDDWLAAQA